VLADTLNVFQSLSFFFILPFGNFSYAQGVPLIVPTLESAYGRTSALSITLVCNV